jgi:hypothetical protein
MLRDAAFTLSRTSEQMEQTDIHEAYFKALAAIDEFNDAGCTHEENHPGAGTLYMTETDRLVGFSLMNNEELIHNAFFATQGLEYIRLHRHFTFCLCHKAQAQSG